MSLLREVRRQMAIGPKGPKPKINENKFGNIK